MRIRFRSLRSLFAPYQEEVECGVHELSFIVPPDASEYTLDLFLVHIDGEGMGEPPYSRLYPEARRAAARASPPRALRSRAAPCASGAAPKTPSRTSPPARPPARAAHRTS